MSTLSIQRELHGRFDDIVERVSVALPTAGFGILTRVDFDQKMKEKLGETVPRTVILGACNPRLAFEAYKKTTDVTLLIPCNVVIRETGAGHIVVEAMKPSAMLQILPQVEFDEMIKQAERNLEMAIANL